MVKKITTEVDNSINQANPNQQRSLKRIDELKRKLVTNSDHLSEVLEWEKQAKRALLKLDLSKHQGVRLFIAGIMEMVKETNELLQVAKSTELSDAERNGLIEKKEFMLWTMNFFTDAKTDLKAIEEELEFQLDGEVESDSEEEEMLLDPNDPRGQL